MSRVVFLLVRDSLLFIGRKTGLTYNEINIIVYYFFIPFSWLLLIDSICQFHYFKFSFGIFSLGFIVGCRNFRDYADWLFTKSVSFLNYFDKYGSNYVVSSVLVCVVLPAIIYCLLLYLIWS